MTTTSQGTTSRGYVHAPARTAGPHALRGRRHRERGGTSSIPTGRSRRPVPGPGSVGVGTEARGFVVYVGMDQAAAAAAGTSLAGLATQLRHYVESVAPDSQCTAAVAIAPAGAPGSDLQVVRQVLGDPTTPPGTDSAVLLQVVPSAPAARPGLVIDLARAVVQLDGEVAHLTDKEFEILHYLLEHRGRTVDRVELIDALWTAAEQAPSERTIDVHIRRLRTKLGRLSRTVRTVRGAGYRFDDHPEVSTWTTPEYSI